MLWPHTKVQKRWLLLREGDIFRGVVVCSLGGESWDGEEEGEIGEDKVDNVGIY